MSLITIEKLVKQGAIGYNVDRFIKSCLVIEDEDIIYPRNIFIDDKKLELFIFKSDKCICITSDDNIEISVRFYKGINGIKLSKGKDHSICINFEDNSDITLNALNDTNEYWTEKFKEIINEIFRMLMK